MSHKILVIEDDFDISEMLQTFFIGQGYAVNASHWGEDGIQSAIENQPNLIILDIRLPDIDGYEVARRLKADRSTREIPIIYLTERRDRADRLKGLEIGADDYITKPFDMMELKLRVKNVISRYQPQMITNSITGLPEGKLVIEKLDSGRKLENTIMAINIQNIDAFASSFGVERSAEVIKNTSSMIRNGLREFGIAEYFLGHLGRSGFVLMVRSKEVEQYYSRLVPKLEMAMEYFYPTGTNRSDIPPLERLTINSKKFSSAELVQMDLDEMVSTLISE